MVMDMISTNIGVMIMDIIIYKSPLKPFHTLGVDLENCFLLGIGLPYRISSSFSRNPIATSFRKLLVRCLEFRRPNKGQWSCRWAMAEKSCSETKFVGLAQTASTGFSSGTNPSICCGSGEPHNHGKTPRHGLGQTPSSLELSSECHWGIPHWIVSVCVLNSVHSL